MRFRYLIFDIWKLSFDATPINKMMDVVWYSTFDTWQLSFDTLPITQMIYAIPIFDMWYVEASVRYDTDTQNDGCGFDIWYLIHGSFRSISAYKPRGCQGVERAKLGDARGCRGQNAFDTICRKFDNWMYRKNRYDIQRYLVHLSSCNMDVRVTIEDNPPIPDPRAGSLPPPPAPLPHLSFCGHGIQSS